MINHKLFRVWISFSFICLVTLIAIFSYPKNQIKRHTYKEHLLKTIENASQFEEFANALFCYEVTTDSITTAYTLKNPTTFQIPSMPPLLTSFSNTTYKKNLSKHQDLKQIQFLTNTLSHFKKTSLSKDQQLTYELLKQQFSLQQQLCDFPYYEELLGSTTGIQANLPVTFAEYPLRTKKEISDYFYLIKQVPNYFSNVIAYEKQRTIYGYTTPPFLYNDSVENVKMILENLQKKENSFTETFENRMNHISSLSKHEKEKYQKKNARYVQRYITPAYQSLYKYLKAHQSSYKDSSNYLYENANTSYGLSSLPNGNAYYTILVKKATGSSRTIPEIISMTDDVLSDALQTLKNIAITDPETYIYYCEHPLETFYTSPQSILESLSLLIRKDYPSLDTNINYQIKTVPDSLATSSSPAFYMIPCVDNYDSNVIYINPLYTSEQNGNLFQTLAHEGFPGHLYQTVYFNTKNPTPIRHMLDFPGYVEGWATYVEINSFTYLDYPISKDNLCQLYQAETIINLALSSRIDLGVNYENWTLKDVQNYFSSRGFNDYHANTLYSYVIEAPSNYLSYFIGYLEIIELKKSYQEANKNNNSDKAFHKAFLDLGPCDFDTAKKYLVQ